MRITKTTTNNKPATNRMSVVLSTLSSFLTGKNLLKRFLDDDGGRPKRHQKNRRKYKKDEGKDELNTGFRRLLLDLLSALRSQGIGVNPQGFGDTGAELL
jgi:hypothetical protein